jgi:hypothetical protein
MTLSPEERAKAYVRDWSKEPVTGDFIADVEALVAKAIREACNEKLEEAALYCDEEAKTPSSTGPKASGRREAGRRLGRVFRALKDKSP